MKLSILAAIVLYKTAPPESVSVTTLAKAIEAAGKDGPRLRVVLVDNGPQVGAAPGIFKEETYLSVPENLGLAHAYNVALRIAQKEGFDWLLTLDQDTSLPEHFLAELVNVMALVEHDPLIAAVVPQISGAGRMLSPYTFRWGALPRWFPPGYSGVPKEATYALNSASLLRVSALRQVGGYAPRFWLDASDHAIFHALSSHGKEVYVAGNIQVQHHLSVLDRAKPMSTARYENMLAAESAFWGLYMNRLANWERNLRLAGRLVGQLRRKETGLQRVSLKHLRLRLLRSRAHRLRLWERATEGRLATPSADQTVAPMVSVCMAAYNGERYIEEQIASILPQLREGDELIVVDDESSDQTKELVRGIGDPRVRLIAQRENRGVVETFEHAVRSATGDLLFLCDGDDIWAPDKVEKMVRAFAENSQAQVVSTGLRLIDENGQALDSSDYMKNREFTAALLPNLVRNRFQGSTMAFRSSLLSRILPFPKRRLFLHDAWIGTCSTMMGGDTVYLAEPLLYYRRHTSNFSKSMGLKGQVMARVQLVMALAARWFRHA